MQGYAKSNCKLNLKLRTAVGSCACGQTKFAGEQLLKQVEVELGSAFGLLSNPYNLSFSWERY